MSSPESGGSDGDGEPKSAAAPPTNPFDRDDKRNEDRAAIQLRVDYKRLNTFFADYTKNISKGGTFIRTSKPLDVGTEFVFVLSVPSHNAQLALKGEVVWVVTEEKATSDSPAGMGIKFKFTDDAERAKVDDVVEKLMDEALGRHISTKLLRKT
jgi:type IV pilus assembly protein PilZ